MLSSQWRLNDLIHVDTIAIDMTTSEQQQREPFNSTAFVAALCARNFSVDQIPHVFPQPKLAKTLEIYNLQAWQTLVELVSTQTEFSICPNGGSATAGGGLNNRHELYSNRLVNYLKGRHVTQPNTIVNITQRGHGTRNSLHSALMMDNYIPPNTDIVLWEFAINDYGYNFENDSKRASETRNELLFWLDRVAAVQPQPPLVILVYLWKRPYQHDENGSIVNPVFDQHQKLAAHYDFVVGHVNLASYIQELNLTEEIAKKVFLADQHHPNAIGHAVVGFLLLELLIREKDIVSQDILLEESNNGKLATMTANGKKPTYQWNCGTETEGKRFVYRRVQPNPKDTPKPLASFTTELPKNTDVFPRMMTVEVSSSSLVKTTLLGKTAENRDDRLLSSTLPCCQSNDVFELVSSSTMQEGIQALLLGIAHYRGPVQVYVGSNTTEPVEGRMIHGAGGWPCLWNFKGIYENAHWFALDHERYDVSRIGLCSRDSCCSKNSVNESCSSLLSLVVF